MDLPICCTCKCVYSAKRNKYTATVELCPRKSQWHFATFLPIVTVFWYQTTVFTVVPGFNNILLEGVKKVVQWLCEEALYVEFWVSANAIPLLEV